MELLLFLLIWTALSFVGWVVFLESPNTYGNSKLREFKIFSFILSTLPATIFLILVVIVHEVIERMQARRLEKKRLEESRYGVFERKVIVEKYCEHMWEENDVCTSIAYRKFRCIKCKKKTQLSVGEFRFLKSRGSIVGDYDREPYIGRIDFLR